MKKFQFGLSNVLEYKQQVLDALQGEYAAIQLQIRKQEELLAEIGCQYADLNEEFRTAAVEGMTISKALEYESGLRFLEERIRQEEKTLEMYRQQAEEKQKQVIAAHQDVASLENLKEKKWEAYRSDVQKSEENFIDELVSAARVTAGASLGDERR